MVFRLAHCIELSYFSDPVVREPLPNICNRLRPTQDVKHTFGSGFTGRCSVNKGVDPTGVQLVSELSHRASMLRCLWHTLLAVCRQPGGDVQGPLCHRRLAHSERELVPRSAQRLDAPLSWPGDLLPGELSWVVPCPRPHATYPRTTRAVAQLRCRRLFGIFGLSELQSPKAP